MRVWLDNWEWQCCGEPFGVGSDVESGLTSVSAEARSFLAEPLGTDIVAGITHCETHHPNPDDERQSVPTRGRVESITAVYRERAPRRGEDPRVYYPVERTAVLESRETANGWEAENDRGPSFEGYIVELTPLN